MRRCHLSSLSSDPVTHRQVKIEKNRPLSAFKIVLKLDSSASVPPPLVSPSRSAGSQMSRECRSPPSSKVKAGRTEGEWETRRRRGRAEARPPFPLFPQFPNDAKAQSNLSFFNRYASHPNAFARVNIQGPELLKGGHFLLSSNNLLLNMSNGRISQSSNPCLAQLYFPKRFFIPNMNETNAEIFWGVACTVKF